VVKDTGKTLHVGAFKPVNTPEEISVEENLDGFPLAFKDKRRQGISVIEDMWRLDEEWWRTEPLSRSYFSVILASGQKIIIFKNLLNNLWYRQTY
jgi:hypothetical protein